jgi:hypothetical protein
MQSAQPVEASLEDSLIGTVPGVGAVQLEAMNTKHSFCKDGLTIALLSALTACAPSSPSLHSNAGADGNAPNNEGAKGSPLALQLNAGYGRRQLTFEPNRGQADGRVNFLARGGEYSLFLEPTEAVLALTTPPHAAAAA